MGMVCHRCIRNHGYGVAWSRRAGRLGRDGSTGLSWRSGRSVLCRQQNPCRAKGLPLFMSEHLVNVLTVGQGSTNPVHGIVAVLLIAAGVGLVLFFLAALFGV